MISLIPITIEDRLQLKQVTNALDKFLKQQDHIVEMQTATDYERFVKTMYQRIFKQQYEVFKTQVNNGVSYDKALKIAFNATNKDSIGTIYTVWRAIIAKQLIDFPKKLKESGADRDETGIPESFRLDSPEAVKRLRAVAANRISKINDVTKARIKELVIEAREKKWSVDRLAKEIESEFESMSIGKPQLHIQSRAQLIATTEYAEASGYANEFSAKEIGETLDMDMLKYWQTQEDDRVSDGCRQNQAAGWIDADDSFPSGDMREPRFPGCRCTVLYKVGE
jgi:hypothetical protein